MSFCHHLAVQEMVLAPAKEWQPEIEGWLVMRIAEGDGYLLKDGAASALGTGDLILSRANGLGTVRSSSLGRMVVQLYSVWPELLGGVLSMVEMHALGKVAAGTPAKHFMVPASNPLAQKANEIFQMPSPESVVARGMRLQLWLEIVSRFQLNPQPAPETNEHNLRARLRQMVSQMSAEEVCASSPSELAARLGYSARHFHRLFCEEFGQTLRTYQTELKLTRARHFLMESNMKIINVAQQSGYNHLGLFNLMFKERFGMPPGQWRRQFQRQAPSPTRRAVGTKVLALILFLCFSGASVRAQTNSTAASAATSTATSTNETTKTNAPERKFEVRNYEITGNTVLNEQKAETFFDSAKGKEVTFSMIDQSRMSLEKAYRERGLVTVKVLIPPQKLTNATIKIDVVESPLAAIQVTGNRYYSSNHILSKFPSLRTNTLLNQFILEKELDAANSGRDYTVTSVLGPGPTPETSALALRVKDQLPLHARLELDNYNTPASPELRANFNAQYDNLWDLDHEVGIQYSFSPEHMKVNNENIIVPLDDPYIANYSAYYRFPIGNQEAIQSQVDANPGTFGYNEATHQFVAPAATGTPELTLYASRATTDSGIESSAVGIVSQVPNQLITVQTNGENITLNSDFGATFRYPFNEFHNMQVALIAGFDYKHFRMAGFNDQEYAYTKSSTNSDGTVSTTILFTNAFPVQRASVDYLPFNVGANFVIPDKWGKNYFTASCKFSILPILSRNDSFNNTRFGARRDYYAFDLNYNREQAIYKNYAVTLRANAQVTTTPLISNEQFALGGGSSVRGYDEGEVYGDSGWDFSVEPHTPYYTLGLAGSRTHEIPLKARLSVFFDYGEAYLKEGGGSFSLAGVGSAITFVLGDHFGAQFQAAEALMDSPTTKAGTPDFRFSLSGQF